MSHKSPLFNWLILMRSSALLLLAMLAGSLSAQTRVVDLSNSAPDLADWKIVDSGAGGPVGTWPMPPSYVPVSLHLNDCAVKNAGFYFSIEIENNRKVEVQVPVSTNSKLFDRRGTIAFRELLIQLGTATNTRDPSTFENDPRFAEIVLFGHQSVPGTLVILAPGERLLLRLKTEMQSPDRQVGGLRVRIGGVDETLSPSDGGYRKIGTYIPALLAISEPACSESKSEAK